MLWCRQRKAYNRNTCVTVFSGLFQAVLALVYLVLAGLLGGSEAVQKTLLLVWIAGVALNAILLPYCAWHMQIAVHPRRHPFVVGVLSAVYTGGSLGSALPLFFLMYLAILSLGALF
jgi:hypothetical protein